VLLHSRARENRPPAVVVDVAPPVPIWMLAQLSHCVETILYYRLGREETPFLLLVHSSAHAFTIPV